MFSQQTLIAERSRYVNNTIRLLDKIVVLLPGVRLLLYYYLVCVCCCIITWCAFVSSGSYPVPMRQLTHHSGHPYPDYEELKRDAPGVGLRYLYLQYSLSHQHWAAF